MEGAKEIARDMLDAINVDSHGFWGAVGKGFISLPVSVYYLGIDFIDTENRSKNFDDKVRMTRLIKSKRINKDNIEKAVNLFMNDFASRIDIENVLKKIGGNAVGKILFSQLTSINLGAALATRAVSSLMAGAGVGLILSVGAEESRAIYTSRYLRERNPDIYYKLQKMGDLDLLYFIFEDTVRPFEKACEIDKKNPEQFKKVCDYFLERL